MRITPVEPRRLDANHQPTIGKSRRRGNRDAGIRRGRSCAQDPRRLHAALAGKMIGPCPREIPGRRHRRHPTRATAAERVAPTACSTSTTRSWSATGARSPNGRHGSTLGAKGRRGTRERRAAPADQCSRLRSSHWSRRELSLSQAPRMAFSMFSSSWDTPIGRSPSTRASMAQRLSLPPPFSALLSDR